MCGRYTLSTVDGRLLAERFELGDQAPPAPTLSRHNVCPTETIAVVCDEGEGRVVRGVRWGLVPPWARELGRGFQPINGRSETVASKPPFAALFARPDRRCLILADGWYEWLRSERPRGERVPFRYTVDGGEPMAFAGLWDSRRLDGAEVASATILTAAANRVCAPVHDRMPCVLTGPAEEATWLAGVTDAELLAPLEDARVAVAPANPAVNRAGVEGPELLTAPPAAAARQLSL